MDLQQIDLDTLQPNGKRGETQRPAFTKINQNFQEMWRTLEEIPAAIAHAVSGRNRLANGNFDVWQRGDSFTAVAGYTADRFIGQQGGMTGAAIFRSPVAVGDSNFPRSRNTLAANSSGNSDVAGHYFLFEQRVEGVHTFAASESTFSFLVYNAGAGGRKIAVEFLQRFGTGGSATVSGIHSEVFTLLQGLNRISKTVSLPPVYGKTIAGGDDSVICAIWLSAGSNFTARSGGLGAQSGQLYFGELQWEAGARATNFEWRPIALELALCQRYFQKSFPVAEVPNSNSNSAMHRTATAFNSGTCRVVAELKSVMRDTPRVAFYASGEGGNLGSPSNWRYYDAMGGAWRAATLTNVVMATSQAFMADIGGMSFPASGGVLLAGHYTADAEL
ncbi:hypothetical protein ACEU0B_001623 [Stenotrophomonas indicatrix]|uniref:hypothetical protein n=1 Tax=Stenotrophomonas indicatrix TaxID=2045451 RepID=UPI0037323CE3